MYKIKINILFILFINLIFSYEVGDMITPNHQNTEYDICHGAQLDQNNDGIFTFSEYNGDLNGGRYYVILLEMSTSW